MPRRARIQYAILREHLIEHVSVSDLCDKHELQPTLFYSESKATTACPAYPCTLDT